MSVLFQKHVLVVGDETSQVHDIESALEREGAHIHTATCQEANPGMLEELKIDVIFLNHLHDNSHCEFFLQDLQDTRTTKVLPIFTLVPDSKTAIERVLTLGAADYFTAQETTASILSKVRIVLGDSINVAGETVLDIGESHFDSKATGIKVLVVEDDALLANLLAIRLNKSSFPHRINKNGEAILQDLDEFKPDVMILDLMLPGKSGFQVLEEIRISDKHKNLPVFIFSNRDAVEDKQKAAELGVAGFYVKAMTDLSDLIQSIEKEVSRRTGK